MRPNLTFSFGLRYETQSNISDHGDFSPRIALAWESMARQQGGQNGAARRFRNLLRPG